MISVPLRFTLGFFFSTLALPGLATAHDPTGTHDADRSGIATSCQSAAATQVVVPQREVTTPAGKEAMPQGDITVPAGEVTVPQGMAAAPQDEVLVPLEDVTPPEGEVVVPQSATAPLEQVTVPEDEANQEPLDH